MSVFSCLRFGKFPPHICESFGATYRHSYESFSALQSTYIPLTYIENSVQIIHNWRCYPSSKCCKIDQKNTVLNWALCCGGVAPSDTTEKNRNMGVQLHSLRCI